jgi:hypothetical protein
MSEIPTNLALLVLPRGALAALENSASLRWLARGDVRRPSNGDLLARAAEILVDDAPEGGRAALRYWGETGHRPDTWLAAADPVFFEARLDHLRLHALDPQEVEPDMGEILEALNAAFGNEPDGLRFIGTGGQGYVAAKAEPFRTPDSSAEAISGAEPSGYLPEGPGTEDYLRLHSEIQMLLHGLPAADRRFAGGQRPVNGLWLWGGGRAPDVETRPLPVLYGHAPVLAGFWHCCGATVRPWPGNLVDCAAEGTGFVASLPAQGELADHLEEARRLLSAGAIREIVVMSADGIDVRLRAAHRFRFWRKVRHMVPPAEART